MHKDVRIVERVDTRELPVERASSLYKSTRRASKHVGVRCAHRQPTRCQIRTQKTLELYSITTRPTGTHPVGRDWVPSAKCTITLTANKLSIVAS